MSDYDDDDEWESKENELFLFVEQEVNGIWVPVRAKDKRLRLEEKEFDTPIQELIELGLGEDYVHPVATRWRCPDEAKHKGLLAGIGGPGCLKDPAGLPPDVSEKIRVECEVEGKWRAEYHTPSYYDLEELASFLAEEKRGGAKALAEFVKAVRVLTKAKGGKVRIVFWFAN